MSGYDITLKRGDTRHAIKAVLKDTDGNPVNLEGCTVAFRMAALGQPSVIDRAAHIQDPVAGEVWVVLAAEEVQTPGIYRAELQVVYGDGRKETFPNTGYLSIQILKTLEG
jgi:hypothetical protein